MEQHGRFKMIYELDDEYYVRSLSIEDLNGPYSTWFEDQEICKYSRHGKFTKTKEHLESFYKNINNESQIVWAICHKEDGHIGNISLSNISFIDRRAEFGILLGDKRHFNKGIGLEAGKKIIAHGFLKLNLERVYCGTSANNLGMQKLAKSLGMTEEGCRRNHLWLDGEWVDVIEYGLLRSEWPKD